MTDYDRVLAAFKELRTQHGFITRANFKCCMTCAGAAISSMDKFKKQEAANDIRATYFHRQDNSAFNTMGYLEKEIATSWRSRSRGYESVFIRHDITNPEFIPIVRAAFEKQGLTVKWDGSSNSCIELSREQVPA